MTLYRLLPRLVLGLLVLSAATAPAARAGAQPAPAAVVETTAFEFEPVVDGAAVRHEFTIANRGDAPLRLLKVRTG
ncbi:MAG: DUF1573 domain-containing protein [Desulfobacteraceae bacterium]|jgi:hypothetical protein|nr:DUF1573 domain-containing protein [Desulfobacteraceae bacterium]